MTSLVDLNFFALRYSKDTIGLTEEKVPHAQYASTALRFAFFLEN